MTNEELKEFYNKFFKIYKRNVIMEFREVMTNEELSKVLLEYYCRYYSLNQYIKWYDIYIDEGELEKIENEMRKDLEEEWDELIEKKS